MAETQNFDGEMGRIGDALKAMRGALDAPASMLAEAAGALALPDGEGLAAESERMKAEAPERRSLEAGLARLVAALAAEIEFRAREVDDREVPTRFERLIGVFSKAAMRRRQWARWRRRRPLDQLGEILRRADLLVGLLRAERGFLLARRGESEKDLVTITGHRPEIIEKLRRDNGEAVTGIEAARRTEQFVEVFQMFVDGLNARVGVCNILLHKLLADVEDLLILCRVVCEIGPQHGEEGLRPDAFANLAAEVERFSTGMLAVHGLDHRRNLANQAFAEGFPAEAEGEASAEARAERTVWRLPAISGFKLARP